MRTQKRKQELGEVFTPIELVNNMLNKLPKECWEISKTFIDNSCGSGNFLVEVLKRKLKLGHNQIKVISTIWGIDIMQDNIDECKERLLELINRENKEEAKKIIDKQIVRGNALKWDYENWKSKEVKVRSLF